SDLRIVLIGKNGSENSRVGNTILHTKAFDSDVPSSYLQQHSERISGAVEGRHITVINTHLLQPNLSYYQIKDGVRECVSLSAPGPHVIALILQYNDFRENDSKTVKYVLNRFSKQAMKHTIVLTTDEQTLRYIFTRNNTIQNLIKECGGGHLQFDTRNPGWRSEMFRRTEKILKEEHEEFLICNIYEDGGSRFRALLRGDNKEKEDSDLKESTTTLRDGGVLYYFLDFIFCKVKQSDAAQLLEFMLEY
ncbi:hypothetical protein M9458_053963, partial [Cirrhinus mrigala]